MDTIVHQWWITTLYQRKATWSVDHIVLPGITLFPNRIIKGSITTQKDRSDEVMRQNCEIEKRQAVRNIEYQKKTGERGKRVQPTDIYLYVELQICPPRPRPGQAFCLTETIYMGQLDPFIKSVSCVCSRKCYRQWTVWVLAHIVSHYYGGELESSRKSGTANFVAKRPQPTFPMSFNTFLHTFAAII